MKNFLSALRLLMVIASVAAPGALLANPVGQTIDVQQSAVIERSGQQNSLQNGQSINLGDIIKTDASGTVQLLFLDDTKIVVGPRSQLVIESILFNNAGQASDFTVNAVEGAFRFLSGKSDKSVYAVRTPKATMGIRGTVFDFTVSP